MINRFSKLINRNRSAAKISQVLCSNINTLIFSVYLIHYPSFLYIYRGMIKNYTKSFDFLHIHYKKVCFIMQKCRKTLQNCELRNVSKFSSDQFPLNTFQQLASVQSISFSQQCTAHDYNPDEKSKSFFRSQLNRKLFSPPPTKQCQ